MLMYDIKPNKESKKRILEISGIVFNDKNIPYFVNRIIDLKDGWLKNKYNPIISKKIYDLNIDKANLTKLQHIKWKWPPFIVENEIDEILGKKGR